MVYHRVLSATSWLVTIRVWIDGYHIISVEDITKSYEISWKENMNGKFPWYCIGHKICQHEWLININLRFFSWRFTLFLRSVYRDTLVSVYRYVSWPPNIGAPRCTGESRHPYGLALIMFYVQKHMTPLGVCSGLPLIRDKPPGAPAFVRLTFFYYQLSSSLLSSSPAFLRCSSLAIIHHQNCLTNHHQQRSRLRHPISKIRMILLMDAKIWIISSVFYLKFFEHPSFGQVAHEIYPSEWKVHSSEISITIMYCWYMFLMAVATDFTHVTINLVCCCLSPVLISHKRSCWKISQSLKPIWLDVEMLAPLF